MMNLTRMTNLTIRQRVAKTSEETEAFIEHQLSQWTLAADNFKKLRETRRKKIPLGSLEASVQCNPARIISTGAKVDKSTIASRRCFLCSTNRPQQQISLSISDNWEMLLNPYPILPVHFTIAHKIHQPQGSIPLEMAEMAEKTPGLVFFFNGAKAGASAPDHLHAQAVMAEELPLIRLVERQHPDSMSGWLSSESFKIPIPFHFMSAVITPDVNGLSSLAKVNGAFGIDADTGKIDHDLLNAFFWIDKSGLLRCVIIPRKKHRPSCYYGGDDDKFLISPGAIDMAGIMIAPRPEDFERLDSSKMNEIYSEVAFSDKLPEQITNHFK